MSKIKKLCPECKKIKTLTHRNKNTKELICKTCWLKMYKKNICPECKKLNILSCRNKNTKELICGNCFSKLYKKNMCPECKKLKILIRRNKNTQELICSNCFKRLNKEICIECGELRITSIRDENKNAICTNCAANMRKEICTECKKLRIVSSRINNNPFCRTCTANMKKEICTECGKLKIVKTGNNNGNYLCRSCYEQNRIKKDAMFHFVRVIRQRIRNAFKVYSKYGKVKSCKEYGINFNAIFEYMGSCPGNRKDYHIDHILPLAAFDFDNPIHVKAAFAPENHQWLIAEDNLRKSDNYNQENFDNYIKKFEEEK